MRLAQRRNAEEKDGGVSSLPMGVAKANPATPLAAPLPVQANPHANPIGLSAPFLCPLPVVQRHVHPLRQYDGGLVEAAAVACAPPSNSSVPTFPRSRGSLRPYLVQGGNEAHGGLMTTDVRPTMTNPPLAAPLSAEATPRPLPVMANDMRPTMTLVVRAPTVMTSEEKTSEFRRHGFSCRPVAPDGSCFFHAVRASLSQLLPEVFSADLYRKTAVDHLSMRWEVMNMDAVGRTLRSAGSAAR